MLPTPDNLSPAQGLDPASQAGEKLRSATRDDIARLGWQAEARGTITATRREIEYCLLGRN